MFRKTGLSLIISVALAGYVHADDVDTSAASEDVKNFYDTDLLIETLTADDAIDKQEAEADLANAKADLDAATEAGEDTTDYVEAVEAAQAELDAIQLEEDDTAILVGELSEEQVFALNRSLNNAADGKLLVDIDAEDLQRVIDGDFNKLQINAFTQAFEQEARFEIKADKFTEKYEESGNEKFLDHASRMEEKGADQKSKFEAKIDRFADEGVNDLAATEAKQVAKDEAKSVAKEEAKGAAKQAAKDAAKQAAKDAAKQAAKDAAKQAAKDAAKQAAKDAAKQAAKDAAKKAAKG